MKPRMAVMYALRIVAVKERSGVTKPSVLISQDITSIVNDCFLNYGRTKPQFRAAAS